MHTINYNITKLCKNAIPKKNKDEPIHIDTFKKKPVMIYSKSQKNWNKSLYGKEKDTFTEFVLEISKEQSDKLEQFCIYCEKISLCVNCQQYIDISFFRSNESDEIVMQCKNCLSNTIDGTKESKDYVKWFNESVLGNYGMSFVNGFPKGLKCEYGTKCEYCGASHDGESIYFTFST